MMRKIIMMIAAMLSVVNIAQAAESLSIADFEITAGEARNVTIELTSDMPYVAFQFDLLLPDGLSVAAVNQNKLDVKLGEDMADDHTLSAQKVSETENLYRFVCFSMTNSAFLKTSGTIMNIAIQAAADVPDGKRTGTLKKIAFTDRSAVEYSFADAPFTVTCKNTTAPTGDIAINETNFPDENFRNYLLRQSYGSDGIITEKEIETITLMYVAYQNISSLKGIEHFTKLKTLYCHYNKLTALDVSKNVLLTRLDCLNNMIKGAAMDDLISSLPTNTTGEKCVLGVYTVLDNDENECTQAQVAAAKKKGWTAYYGDEEMVLQEYFGCDATGKGTIDNPFTPAEANAYGGALAANEESEEDYYIRGMVVSIKEQFGTQYGNATFYISADGTETDQFYIYRALYLGNTKYAGQDLQLRVGDDVVVCGKITNYLGRLPETVQEKAYVVSINGITSGIKDVTSDGKANAPVYTLQGQKVTTPQKGGIYIVGGKKMVVK